MFNIPVRGTHAHAFISSFHSKTDQNPPLKLQNRNKGNVEEEFLPVVDKFIEQLEDVLTFSRWVKNCEKFVLTKQFNDKKSLFMLIFLCTAF